MNSDCLMIIGAYLNARDLLRLCIIRRNINVENLWKDLIARDYPQMPIDTVISYKQNYRQLYTFIKMLLELKLYVYVDAAIVIYQISRERFFAKLIRRLIEGRDTLTLYDVRKTCDIVRMTTPTTIYDGVCDEEIQLVKSLITTDQIGDILRAMNKLRICCQYDVYNVDELKKITAIIDQCTTKEQRFAEITKIITKPALCFYRRNGIRCNYINLNYYELAKFHSITYYAHRDMHGFTTKHVHYAYLVECINTDKLYQEAIKQLR